MLSPSRWERRARSRARAVSSDVRQGMLRSTEARDWQMAYRLAVRAATEDVSTCEVVALASMPLARAALSACGFRWRGSIPLSVNDPQGKLAAAPPLCWSLIEDDAAYVT